VRAGGVDHGAQLEQCLVSPLFDLGAIDTSRAKVGRDVPPAGWLAWRCSTPWRMALVAAGSPWCLVAGTASRVVHLALLAVGA
jgi:hypothetical protein